jgi:uncharacterized membrane-anchored protein
VPIAVRKISVAKSIYLPLIAAAILCVSLTCVAGAEDKALPNILGPAKIALGKNIATMDMPGGYRFVEEKYAKELLQANGDPPDGVLGLIFPETQERGNEEFAVICRFEDAGHVRDDDADQINSSELLQQYKDGTKEQNDERKEHGVPPIYVGNWAEKPRYNKQLHHLVWAIEVKDQDSPEAPVAVINYNTRVLGRNGYLSMNLVTSPNQLENNKQKIGALLADTHFVKGNSYQDYKPGVDKDAGFGLAGLVLGGGALAAAAKMGILGGLGKWLIGIILVLKKSIFLVVAGVGAVIAKLFGKKKVAEAETKTDV